MLLMNYKLPSPPTKLFSVNELIYYKCAVFGFKVYKIAKKAWCFHRWVNHNTFRAEKIFNIDGVFVKRMVSI